MAWIHDEDGSSLYAAVSVIVDVDVTDWLFEVEAWAVRTRVDLFAESVSAGCGLY